MNSTTASRFPRSATGCGEQGFDASLKAFGASRRELGFDVVDLYLIHWPVPSQDLYLETWRAFEMLYADGAVRAIGISNFLPDHVARLVEQAKVVPAVNQIELHPSYQQPATQQASRDAGIAVEAYAPIGQAQDLDHAAVTEAAQVLDVSPGQMVPRWHIQNGTIVIPTSVTPHRIQSNLDVFSFELNDAQMQAVPPWTPTSGCSPTRRRPISRCSEIVGQVRITDLDALADAATALVHDASRVILGITGAPGSGKSTLVQALVRELSSREPPHTQRSLSGPWVAQVPMDGFHLADASLERLGLLEVKGAPETFDAYGYAAVLARIADPAQREITIYAPTFERDVEQPIAGAIAVPPSASLVITEGNYLLLPDDPWPSVREHLAQVWHCATDESRRKEQLIRRHIEHGKSPQDAREWALGPDEANATKVRAASRGADLIVGEELLQSASS